MLTIQANTIVDDTQTLAKAQAEIVRLKSLLTHTLKQLEGLDGQSGEVLFNKLLAENEQLRQENKTLKRALKMDGGHSHHGESAHPLSAVREEEESVSTNDERDPSRRRRPQKQSQKRGSLDSLLKDPPAGAGRRGAENNSSSSRSDGSIRRSQSNGNSLHSLINFSYFDLPNKTGATGEIDTL